MSEPSARRRGLSLTLKTVFLFVVIALLPVGVVSYFLAEANRDAVETSERQLKAAVIAEVAGETLRVVEAARDDANAIAVALSIAAANDDTEDQLRPVRALLASRRAVDAVRFEVPAARVSTVIAREGADRESMPESSQELRDAADERGVGFIVAEDGTGVVVVPVPATEGGAKGYVTARVDLSRLGLLMETVAATRFESSKVRMLVADGSRRVVAAYGIDGAGPGSDVAALPVWGALPDGTTWTARVGVVSSHVEDGEPMLAGIETVPDLGWAVAVWRPEKDAYRVLSELETLTLVVVLAGLLLALVMGTLAARRVTRPILRIAEQAKLIGQRRWRDVALESDRGDELGELATSVHTMAKDLENGEKEIAQQAQIRADLSRFMSRELVEAIVEGEHPLTLGGQRAEVSVLFADVVAFTPLAESRPAEQVVTILNELFSMLTEIVFRHGGTVDKFIGDCIMAIWGAPVAQADHAERALAAAEDMMRFLETANEEWREKYDVEIRLGIGVNSGEAIVGNVGSDKRMEYTVIGDVVNVAARLEAIAAPNQLLVGEATQRLAGRTFELTSLGEKNLTGRRKTSTVYQLETEG